MASISLSRRSQERYVRHILVEDAGSLAGIVSARDLLGAYAAADASGLPDDGD